MTSDCITVTSGTDVETFASPSEAVAELLHTAEASYALPVLAWLARGARGTCHVSNGWVTEVWRYQQRTREGEQ